MLTPMSSSAESAISAIVNCCPKMLSCVTRMLANECWPTNVDKHLLANIYWSCVRGFKDKVREARLRWYGHMQWREDDDCIKSTVTPTTVTPTDMQNGNGIVINSLYYSQSLKTPQ